MTFDKANSFLKPPFGPKLRRRLMLLLFVALVIATGQACPAYPAGEIRDPNLHTRWMMVHDAANRGGPARLVEIHGEGSPAAKHAENPPVIRTGNRVRVEAHSAVLDAVLEGVALETAAPGEILRVRLAAGGQIVRASALASGSAILVFVPEAWR